MSHSLAGSLLSCREPRTLRVSHGAWVGHGFERTAPAPGPEKPGGGGWRSRVRAGAAAGRAVLLASHGVPVSGASPGFLWFSGHHEPVSLVHPSPSGARGSPQ